MTDGVLQRLSELAITIMADERFGTKSGFACGVELEQTNIFEENEAVIYVCKPRTNAVKPDNILTLRCDVLNKMGKLPADTPDQTVLAEIASRSGYPASEIPIEVLLFNQIGNVFSTLTAPISLMTMLSTPDPTKHLIAVFGDTIPIINYRTTFTALVAEIHSTLNSPNNAGALAIPGIGLLSWGHDPEDAYNVLNTIVEKADYYVTELPLTPVRIRQMPDPDPNNYQPDIVKIASTRAELSHSVERPLIAVTDNFRDVEPLTMTERIAVTAADLNLTRLASVDSAIVVDDAFGVLCAGESITAAETVQDIARRYVEMMRKATLVQQFQPSLPENLTVPRIETSHRQFTGEVVFLTGAASGIGKATTEVFLERGAAVAGFDINPQTCEMWADNPNFLGIHGDVTSVDDVRSGIAATVQRFGGIDIAFLNAGINEDHADLNAFDSKLWDWVMNTNLSANAMLLRELHSIIRLAPKYGRVIFNASKSAPAPGPGSSSYTVSKMGLIQLARLTALEWAADGIRCYVVNPNAVFDTNIWKDNMAEKRAAHYGMTLEEYRRNNLLKVRIWSRDVGELVADLCGDHFAKTTGFQLPIDGGNARVL